ncbi:MAG: DNA-3-methyladenine glycosylase [Alphaproteobacteria bacterium]|nr:DNA-3-methyladenine glycosylase [Alphaproteobacteria bacterium]
MIDFKNYITLDTYLKDPFEVATKHLLGAYLCSEIGEELTIGKITELEVYLGDCDKACHAYPNKITPRNRIMFANGGYSYVFFVYGMYNQFNVVVSKEGEGNAILIRSLEPVYGVDTMIRRRRTDKLKNLTTGPGKLCQALGISAKQHNGLILNQSPLWISAKEKNYEYVSATRIGIDYAEEYKDKLWRFYIKDSPYISKK